MTNTKMTKKDYFAKAIEIINDSIDMDKDAVIAALKHEIELLEKRSNNSSPSALKKIAEMEVFSNKILEALSRMEEPVTVDELRSKADILESNQRVTTCLTKLKKEGKVNRIVEKKKAYFSIVKEKESDIVLLFKGGIKHG